MKQLVRNAKILGTGSYLPEKVYTNEYLETIVVTNSAWIFKNLGIKERRIAAENEATSDLAWKAGKNAIADAKLQVSDIQLIIVATSTPDRLAPSTASFVQHKLEAYHAVAFDIAAVVTHCNSDEGFLAYRLYTDGRGRYHFTVPAGGSEKPASEKNC